MELLAVLGGGVLMFAGVWLGYRMGYQARTGQTPAPLTEPEYGGVVLDAAVYPESGEAADE